MRDKWYFGALPCLLVGASLTAFTLIFPAVGILEWFSLALMMVGVFRLCEDGGCSAKKAYGYGFLTIYVYYFIIYHWFLNLYPLDFVGLNNQASVAVVLLGWFGLPLLQAVVGGLVFLGYRLAVKGSIPARLPLVKPFLFAALWVIFEWSSTLAWTGVPWGRLALGQIKMLPMVQSASLLGSYFVSFLLLSVAGLLALAILNRPKAVICGVVAVSIFAANLIFGTVSYLVPRKSHETVRVAVVQGNIDSHEKWGNKTNRRTREIYESLTRQAAEEGAKLVVWPETVFPYDAFATSSTRNFLCDLAEECDVSLVVGALTTDDEDREYNVLFWVDPDGGFREAYYAKRHLVPFGEYVPMREVIAALIPPLAELSMLDDLSPGRDSALFETQWGEVGSLICFDSIYEGLTIDSVRDGADLMILATNDSWFSDSAGVYQHQAQAQLRAIESGRYFARSANTGISTILSPTGEILEWIDPLTEGYAVAEVGMRSQTTLYTAVDNLFVYLCIAAAAALPIVEIVVKKRQK